MRRPSPTGGRKNHFLDKVHKSLLKMVPDSSDDPVFEASHTNILSDVKYVILTGIGPLDILTGGIPMGRTVEIFGLDQAGKTALALLIGIRCQCRAIVERVITPDADGFKTISHKTIEDDAFDTGVVYVDNEQSFINDNTMIVNGIKPDFEMIRCDTLNQVFESMDRTIDVITEIQAADGRLQLSAFVLDSLASTTSDQELTQKWGSEDYARQPKQIRLGFRKLMRKINQNNVCFIAINQVSDSFIQKIKRNPRAMPDETDYSTFGGRGIKYSASMRLFLQRVPKKFKLNYAHPNEDGMVVEIRTTKNRLNKPWRKVRVVLLFGDANRKGGGYNHLYSVLETLIMLKLAEEEAGEVKFRFQSFGIETTTFGTSRRSPSISSKADWPDYHLAHEEDFAKMWKVAEKLIFSDANETVSEDEEDEDNVFVRPKAIDGEDLE